MFIHNVIKINYIEEGYLPNVPYRLITDAEMFEAFLSDTGYFQANYPCVCSHLKEDYDKLIVVLKYHITNYLENEVAIPSWVYTYMLGSAISINSDERDISYLYELLNLDEGTVTVFTDELAEQCYQVSKEWIKKTNAVSDYRPPTMFGEPHVIKSLRLSTVDVINNI